ncbi:MAG: DUF5698 domain-containing protein [Anaerolineales bacterium]|nr:DUF5698 domain-containing protein [Anaerolineales bacterium]
MLEILLSPAAWLGALSIFALRVADMTFDTLRVLFVMRGRKGIAWILGFCQSAIFVIAITSVLSQLNNPLNFVGYAAGFATGNVVGMWIEERLAIGHIKVSIVSASLGAALAGTLPKAYSARGWLRRDRDPGAGQKWHGQYVELQRTAQGCDQGRRHHPCDRCRSLCHLGGCASSPARVLESVIRT